MYKCATQRMYNQGTKAGNTIINTLLNDFTIKKTNDQSKFPIGGQEAYPCSAAAPLTISVNSVVIAACLARL